MSLDLRPARPDELDDLVALEADGMGADAWGWSALGAELAAVPDSRTVLVVTRTDEPGLAAYGAVRVVDATADLQRVVVARALRRHGLGRLLQALLDAARARGCREVLLEVRVGNRAAVALYETFGFAEISRRRGYFAPQRDAAVLRLALPPD
ncbi:MAG: GNAT family N-acetyltransferase [Actinomycetota bacterium]|nr:GNAT family N-acetyltransferase [Actinomycetota bacterium]